VRVSLDFKGRTIVVTGATSGLGKAFAEAFAREGANLMIVGRDRGRANELFEYVISLGGLAGMCLGDVADSNFCEQAIDLTLSQFGGLDVLVNSAGVTFRGDALETSVEDWKRVMAVNVDSVFYMSRAAVRIMEAAKRGAIVNMASVSGLVGAPWSTAYCASKGAVVSLTRAMALDHAKNNIRVNAVCPGPVDTPMLVSGYESKGLSPEQVHEMKRSLIPQRRIPKASEIAEVVLFLASDRAGHITGAALPVDGGYTAQ
jgi:meso-butanediol dehydrogenase / (S,S)-butanediol dehydrogenase / diacetyl reductase